MRTIMVVDDNVTNLNVARKALDSEYKVLPMVDGAKALKMMQKLTPELILLDVEMPDMNGLEVMEKVKELGAPFSEIPIIFVSGKDDDETKQTCLDMGAVDYIVKPYEFDFLLSKVATHIK